MKGNRFGLFLKCLLPFLGFVGIQLLVMLAGAVGISISETFSQASQGITDVGTIADLVMDKLNGATVLLILISDVLTAVLFGWIYHKRRKGQVEKAQWKKVFSAKSLVLILLLAVGIQITTTMALSLLESMVPEWFEGYNRTIQSTGMGTSVLSISALVLAAPAAEELVFRGMTLSLTEGLLPFAAANVLQAVLFGIVHGNLVQGIYAFCFGLVFGFVCHSYGTIWASVLLHALVNLIGCILSAQQFGAWPAAVQAAVLLLSLFLLIGSVLLILKGRDKPKEGEVG